MPSFLRNLAVALFLLSLLSALWAPGVASAQTPRLVRDLRTDAPSSPPFSSPRSFVALGDQVLFHASDPADGFEPWASDGTAEGTRLVADLCPGRCDSDFTPLWSAEGRLVFTAFGGVWSTDGTAGGTVRLPGAAPSPTPTDSVLGELTGPPRLVYPGPGSDPARLTDRALWVTDGTPAGTRPFFQLGSPSRDPLPGTGLGGSLLFVRDTPDAGEELWVTDGTEGGTRLLADILPGDGSSSPRQLASLDSGLALFEATGPTAGRELWRSDGTSTGTRRVVDLNPGPGSSNILLPPIVDGGRAFFLAEPLPSDGSSLQLWVSDGTGGGTRALTAFANPEPFGDRQDLIRTARERAERIQVIGSRLYFVAADGASGRELWTSDGTLLGTRRVADLCPGPCASDPRLALGHVPGSVLFTADDGTGRRPWVSDGTAAGTRPLVTSCSGPCPGSAFGFRSDGQRVFFVAVDDPGSQRQLWVTDGTSAGTERLTDFAVDAIGLQGGPDDDGFVGGLYLFVAHEPATGTELWVSDGTAAGTGLLADFAAQATVGSNPVPVAAVGPHALFTVDEPDLSRTLWVTDGSAPGTRPASDLVSGGGPVRLVTTIANEALLYTEGRLWASDGTPGGTQIIADVPVAGSTAARSESAGALEADGEVAVAMATGHLAGRSVFFLGADLWVSDATPEGTGPIAPLQSVVGNPVGPFFATLGDRVVLAARSEGQGIPASLWITDGTEAGTRLISSGEGGEDFLPQQLTTAGGRVLFGTQGGAGGFELWATDGTAQGTGRLGAPLSRPRDLTAVGSRVFFTASRSLGSRELWVSDGTPAGTRVVGPVPREGSSAVLRQAAPFGGRLAFVPDDPVFGHELWVSDGTASGTRRVVDLWPGRAGSEPEHLEAVGDRLVFTASTPAGGRELWMTDGTAAGTVPLFDLIPGAGSSSPSRTLLLGGTLLFGADDGALGRELWALDLEGGGPPAGSDPPPPPGPWLTADSLPGFRVKVRITPQAGASITGSREPVCIPETLCVSGALAGRSEVFVRVVGPRPNGRLWPILVKFSTSQVEVWIEQLASGEVEYYLLEGARPGFDELPGLFDREGFRPQA